MALETRRVWLTALAALLVALAAVRVLRAPLGPPPAPPPKRAPRDRLFTRDELAAHGDGAPTLLLAVLGSVYDVSAGRGAFYGPGQEYAYFVGRDASRAFVTGNASADLTDDLSALRSDREYLSVVGWRRFYERHEAYTREGRLAGGAFYDGAGEPTPALAHAHERAAVAEAELAAEAARVRVHRMARCSSSTEGGARTDWCEAPGHVPREVRLGEDFFRCVCVEPAMAEIAFDEAQGGGVAALTVPAGCAPEAARCAQPAAESGSVVVATAGE